MGRKIVQRTLKIDHGLENDQVRSRRVDEWVTVLCRPFTTQVCTVCSKRRPAGAHAISSTQLLRPYVRHGISLALLDAVNPSSPYMA